MTTARPGELVFCERRLHPFNPHPLESGCRNPRPAVATAAPQAEAGPHSLQPHESCAVESCEIAKSLMASLDERNDLATQRDELADALKAVIRIADRATDEFNAARAALKKAGRR